MKFPDVKRISVIFQNSYFWIAVATVFGAYGTMVLVRQTRVKELESILKNLSSRDEEFRTFSLLTRYQLIINQKNEEGENEEGELKREKEIFLSRSFEPKTDLTGNAPAEYAGIIIVNFFNRVAGSPPVRDFRRDKYETILDLAYYHQQRKNYIKAIEVYTKLAEMAPDGNDIVSRALLHRGFCYSALGERGQATQDFQRVTALKPGPQIAEAARLLIAFHSGVDEQLQAVAKMQDVPEKGEILYRLGAYAAATQVFRKYEKLEISEKFLYFYGRSLEEIGAVQAATGKYRAIIGNNPRSVWARHANRRLFALGSFYSAGNEYRIESAKHAELTGDTKLLNDAKQVNARIEKSAKSEQGTREKLAEVELELKKTEVKNPAEAPAVKSAVILKNLTTIHPELAENREVVVPQTKPTPPAVLPPKTKPAPAPRVIVPAKATPAVVALPAPKPALAPEEKNTASAVTPAAKVDIPLPPQVSYDLKNKSDAIAAGAKLSRAEKKKILAATAATVAIITTEDGNEFTGVIFEEDSETVRLFTASGNLSIPKSAIVKRTSRDSG